MVKNTSNKRGICTGCGKYKQWRMGTTLCVRCAKKGDPRPPSDPDDNGSYFDNFVDGCGW